MIPTTAPIPFDHIVFTEFDDREGVLVDLNAKRYYTLNETATHVWRLLEKHCTFAEIVNELTAIYDVTDAHAAASVERLLSDLRMRGLVRQR